MYVLAWPFATLFIVKRRRARVLHVKQFSTVWEAGWRQMRMHQIDKGGRGGGVGKPPKLAAL